MTYGNGHLIIIKPNYFSCHLPCCCCCSLFGQPRPFYRQSVGPLESLKCFKYRKRGNSNKLFYAHLMRLMFEARWLRPDRCALFSNLFIGFNGAFCTKIKYKPIWISQSAEAIYKWWYMYICIYKYIYSYSIFVALSKGN